MARMHARVSHVRFAKISNATPAIIIIIIIVVLGGGRIRTDYSGGEVEGQNYLQRRNWLGAGTIFKLFYIYFFFISTINATVRKRRKNEKKTKKRKIVRVRDPYGGQGKTIFFFPRYILIERSKSQRTKTYMLRVA